MTRKLYFAGAMLSIALLIAACGTVAEPQYETDHAAEATVDDHAVVEVTHEPTAEPTQPPTATPLPPTNTPTPQPPTATLIPSTVVPTTIPTDESAATNEEDRIAAAVAAADPAEGQALFTTNACASCHLVDTENPLVGPGLLNVFGRAGSRVENQGPYEYIFTSIRSSQAFVVPGFPAGVMPPFPQLSDENIYNIMAYLHTLGN